MISIRKSNARGHADHGWLVSRHSFSFADYYDPRHMGLGNLRVINEDRIAPGTGFGTHGHRDMEIISYVLAGALAHKDSLGTGARGGADGVIRPGDVQRMSAGTGIRHSEFNAEPGRETHFLQIWIEPARTGVAPDYEQKHFGEAQRRGRLQLLVSPDGRDGSLRMNADALVWGGLFDAGESHEAALPAGRLAYVHLARGSLAVNGVALEAGDAAALSGEAKLRLDNGHGAEAIVFDLAP